MAGYTIQVQTILKQLSNFSSHQTTETTPSATRPHPATQDMLCVCAGSSAVL